ncbi:tryptophan RNA-binding attenuator protein-like domain-containing protein [Aspergillus flavus]|uniref:Altered inheritance of mitochondria protein 24, mitochondrial n=1 Tax=Aspergillus flavus (strain ATCC 200026 / FGSC A1120 / IAM 13836 / NRRL 3357 / JCM 12722 / SRRC 167) TaxID=332952 RepID=A0A7U2MRF2_ASPFN|nr:tryptophan RNA-binding attenuator protein-like domain-containing protein [Aspergillus flavus]
MATTYFPPPPQDPQFPPSHSNPQSLSDFSQPNFSFPPPQRQQTAPAVSPFATDTNAAAYTANGDIGNPYGSNSVSPPPQSSTPPAAVQPQAAPVVSATSQDEVGTFNGGSYRISHRDTNSVLTMQLAMGCPIEAKPGAMVAMSGDISLRGTVKFGLAKMVAGGMTSSIYTGPGEILLAPPFLGDIIVLRMDGSERWKVGKDAFLAKTSGVEKDYKSQGMTKAVFSGEGFIIYHMSGVGLVWLQSFGAIIRKDVSVAVWFTFPLLSLVFAVAKSPLSPIQIPEGKTYLVDNGYIVAWNCKYKIERAASGGLLSAFSSSEGLACKFEGPGTVYLQTRNAAAFAAHLSGK